MNRHGYVTLLSVLIVSAIGSAIAVSLLLLGTGAVRNSLVLEQSQQAYEGADTCGEEALERLRTGTTGNFSNTLSISHGSCSYTVTNSGGENYSIESSATIGTIVRKTKISVDQITGGVHITSWQEVADF